MAEVNVDLASRAGGILKTLVQRSGKKLEKSRRRGEDVMKYYKADDYDFIYQSMDEDLYFKACVKKVWEAFTTLIGYMTPELPHRTIDIRARDFAPGSEDDMRHAAKSARLAVVERMLNWSVGESDYTKHVRSVILDFLARGRGVAWTGIHPRKDVVTTIWTPEADYSCDPTALIDEDVMWKGRSLMMPRSRAYQLYPEAQEILRRTPRAGKRFDTGASLDGTTNAMDSSLDCLRLHTVYMLNSINEYEGGLALRDDLKRAGVSDKGIREQLLSPDPMRYTFNDDGILIDASPWEVPLHTDGLWPCTELVAFDDNASRTPISPLDAAIKFVDAINWLTTLTMGKARTTMRLLMALKEHNGQGLAEGDKVRAIIGKDLESITVKSFGDPGASDLRSHIQTFNWDNNWINPALSLIGFFEQKFDELSGVNQIVRSGQPNVQDRSAEAVKLRRETSFNRVDDMRNAVMKFHDEVSRKESIYLQFLKGPDYIGKIQGKQAAQDYGFLGEEEDKNPITWMQRLIEEGADPATAQEVALERALRCYTVDDILHESCYTTKVGEGPRRNREAKMSAMSEFNNQTAPMLLQTGDPMDAAMVFEVQAENFNEIGIDQRIVQQMRDRAAQLRNMAMNPPQPQPGAEQPMPEGVPA